LFASSIFWGIPLFFLGGNVKLVWPWPTIWWCIFQNIWWHNFCNAVKNLNISLWLTQNAHLPKIWKKEKVIFWRWPLSHFKLFWGKMNKYSIMKVAVPVNDFYFNRTITTKLWTTESSDPQKSRKIIIENFKNMVFLLF